MANNNNSDVRRSKMAMQATQGFDDAFPNVNVSFLLAQILEGQAETNRLLTRIEKLLEDE